MALFASDPAVLRPLSFFADASSRDREYMVAGGLAVDGARISEIDAKVAELRELGGIKSEFHWSDYRGGHKREAYEALVRYAFELVRAKQAALHIIIVKFGGYNHRRSTGENKNTSINRMYYQLLLHRVARYYGAKRAIHVRLDHGDDSADICAMRNELCAAAFNTYKTKPNCVRTLEPICSRTSGILQMADVIMGAVAAKRNGFEHTSAKGALADFVLAESGRKSWASDTPFYARFLTVWNHKTVQK